MANGSFIETLLECLLLEPNNPLYWQLDGKMTWDEARAACSLEHGTLPRFWIAGHFEKFLQIMSNSELRVALALKFVLNLP